LTVAGRVTGGGKQRLTESTIQLCDKMWVQYVASRDGRPADSFVDDNGVEFPLVDGRVAAGPNGDPVNGMSAPSEPTLSLFLLNAVKSPEVDALVKSLDPRFI